MQKSSDRSPETLKLNCLDGKPVPPIVVKGWKQLGRFSEQHLEAFWKILGPVLLTPDTAANQELIALFCKENNITLEAMLSAVGCCEVLLKQAAAMDLTSDALQQDLAKLPARSGTLHEFILKHYPEAKKELRQKILMETLTAHGKVMTGLEWRLDKVQHSSRGNRLNTNIVLLTLHYQEGYQQDRITLQLTREAAQQLRTFCDRIIDQGD